MSEGRLSLGLELSDETGQAAPYLGLLRAVAERAVATQGLEGAYELAITVVSDGRIRELNRVHRGVDRVTDVLSFPLQDGEVGAFVLPGGAPTHLGDVVIAFGRAAEQAGAYGHSLEREIAYLAAHGVLHLLGFDHEAEDERVAMRAREEEILFDLPREVPHCARAEEKPNPWPSRDRG
ncbi:MAG TPA: rRNA maturation RNase YbeY [Chloroflexota bacterium]|nr:rRNA maturation RNase YbeY [Chloroflexota bacterium]